ncbi:MAG: phosphoribosylformylglycinamidine synthase subunit PurS [Methanomassiliicoccales archaeon]|nr:phosphoribosylformylglycinamidine synthase subunit PurS [Methanomassiliicoccales archaeon]NYT14858.1 phosphoribosylformylglycinamidine synthase subunit PurS [Methanomassiliicoccales archaeon]
MVIAEIRIELKPGVADPEGQNTRKALELLGFEGIKNVRSIKLFEVDLDLEEEAATNSCEEMCKKLLANPVIQSYRIDIR